MGRPATDMTPRTHATNRSQCGILPRARWIQHRYRTRHRRRRRRGACSHALWPTRRASLAKPKNSHGALVYLLLEPLSLGIPVKARCELAKRPADSVCHLPKSAGNNTRDRHNPGSKGLMGSALLRQYRQHRLRIKPAFTGTYLSRSQVKGATRWRNRCRTGGGGCRIASRVQIVCAAWRHSLAS
jgi:hypothetical protein